MSDDETSIVSDSNETVIYKCPRCHHVTTNKSNYIRHLERKIPCKAKYEDIPLSQLLDKYSKQSQDKHFKCRYCDKMFAFKPNRSRHMRTCTNKEIETNKTTQTDVVDAFIDTAQDESQD